MTPHLLLALGMSIHTAPPVSPRQVRVFEGQNRQEARLRNLYGVVRIRLSNAVSLEDAAGPYLLLRYQVRNARSIAASIAPRNLQIRLRSGAWLAAEGISSSPPLASYPFRPSLSSRTPVEVPRDQTWPLYASFRTELPASQVDPAVVLRGLPIFLLHPLRASLEALAAEAIEHAEKENLPLAEGLLAEAARASPAARLQLGSHLVKRARELRESDRPVLEDRTLRLALPYASNPAFVQARLAEIRRAAGRRLGREGWGPPSRDWRFHQRRSEQYRVAPVRERLRRRGER